jgi:hypothetical protein
VQTQTHIVWFEADGERIEWVVEQTVAARDTINPDRRLLDAVEQAAQAGDRFGYITA